MGRPRRPRGRRRAIHAAKRYFRSRISWSIRARLAGDSSVPLKHHQDKVGPVSTIAFVTCVWMTVCTVADILAGRGVKLFIHPSHNVPGDTTAHDRLDAALAEYKRRIAGV